MIAFLGTRIRGSRDLHEPRPKARVLVVDDEEMSRANIQAALTLAGYETDLAEDGTFAVALVRDIPYDLILMDLKEPFSNGIEATRLIRSLRGAGSEVPIIALSSSPLDGAMREAGMDDFIAKPIDMERLVALVREWVRRGPLRPTRWGRSN